jgi:hypothetical protein
MTEIDKNPRISAPEENSIEDEDCYQDGYCCNSGCRHCPWKDKPSPLPGS